jgi:hypothetical protein
MSRHSATRQKNHDWPTNSGQPIHDFFEIVIARHTNRTQGNSHMIRRATVVLR